MSVCANGHLIYGFVRTDETDDLFTAVIPEGNEDEEYDVAFEEMHLDLQEKHHVSLFTVGYAGVDILSAFSASASAKGMDIQPIDAEKLAKTEEYKQNIAAFLQELGIDPTQYNPGWYILGYMD